MSFDDDFNPPIPPPAPQEYRQAQARAASIPPHELRVQSIERQRQKVEQCSAADIETLKELFIESLPESARKFYARKLDGKRLPTMFIVFAHQKIVEVERCP